MSKERAQDWVANDDTKDGYLEETKPDNKGYNSEPADKSAHVVKPSC